MLIVDGQVHIWAANTAERPWPARHAPHRQVPLGHQELISEMDAAGVHRAILVPPSWEGERNDLVLEAARLYPKRFAVMGRLDTDLPNAKELAQNWKNQPGMLGMRFTFRRPQLSAPLVEGRLDWLWSEAEKRQIHMMILVTHQQVKYVDSIAQRYPGLNIIMDHMGLVSGTKDEAAFAELDLLLAIAKRPNVAVKVSSLPAYTSDAYPYKKLHPYLRRAYDAFGPQRLFWGTDLSRLPCTYHQGITMFTEEIPWLSEDDKTWMMGKGICHWLGWDAP
jgi:predicted TIM-barrel fold metal-dependent hydrolase